MNFKQAKVRQKITPGEALKMIRELQYLRIVEKQFENEKSMLSIENQLATDH